MHGAILRYIIIPHNLDHSVVKIQFHPYMYSTTLKNLCINIIVHEKRTSIHYTIINLIVLKQVDVKILGIYCMKQSTQSSAFSSLKLSYSSILTILVFKSISGIWKKYNEVHEQ